MIALSEKWEEARCRVTKKNPHSMTTKHNALRQRGVIARQNPKNVYHILPK